MSTIVLTTLNARYIHCAFGLRYLLANMGDLQSETALLEFTISQPTLDVVDAILEQRPRIVGFGIYIWNVEETTRVVADLKQIRPDIHIVLGGPEVSYESNDLSIVRLADQVITAEADLAFPRYCQEYLNSPGSSPSCGSAAKPLSIVSDDDSRSLTSNAVTEEGFPSGTHPTGDPQIFKIQTSPLPILSDIVLPYELYTDEDIQHRVIYVEASRGCPFTCEFCLSALDIPVRQFPLEQFLAAMETLLQRGARQFKFVDRTFNLNLKVGREILEFFLARYQPGLFLHFEMIPDRLPETLKESIGRFPRGALQFEVGIQTFDEQVCERISRRQDNDLVEQNLTWLREKTGVHIHSDLIVGLPGETLESFARGFDRLVRLKPHEIQVGILKRLRGTPIIRHDAEWKMVYSPHPPYEILSNRLLSYEVIQELRRFAKYWDMLANSGNFLETLPLLWTDSEQTSQSPFEKFRSLANWLFQRERKTHGIPLGRLIELVLLYFIEIQLSSASEVAATLWRDYRRGGRSDKPHALRPYIDAAESDPTHSQELAEGIPRRQARHL
jgi:radical SAM superfamily enzyme YgiQ (UPF0313 family)